MRSYISFGELEELGETIVREYLRKTKRYNALCVDIEGLVTDYLGLTVVYENIAEDDPNKIAFLSNGKRPLWVSRNEERIQIVFPKGTVVYTLTRGRAQCYCETEPDAGCRVLS